MDKRSPEKAPSDEGRFDSGLNVLFLASFPLVLWFFQGSMVLVVTAILQMALLSFALRLISQGQKIKQAYDAASVAKRPKLPRKVLGSVLIGVVVLVLSGHHFVSLGIPMALGLIATGLGIAAFGTDPWKDKGHDNPAVVARMETDQTLTDAEGKLTILVRRITDLGDTDLHLRTQGAADMVMRLLRATAQDPEMTRRLQKPTEKFTQILATEVERLEDAWDGEKYLFARRRFVAKLAVVTEGYETHVRKLGDRLGGDAFDLEADLLIDRMRSDSAA